MIRSPVQRLASSLCSSMSTMQTRNLSSKKSLARGKRLRGGGAIPGPRYGGKLSTDMDHPGESMIDAIRNPRPVTNPIKNWKILRGDFVQVTSGPEKGKRGHVLQVIRASNRVVVEGVGYVKKHVPQPGGEYKKVFTTEGPIYVSRVNVVCPETNLPTRVGHRFLEDGTKVRVSVRSGAIIPRPEILKQRRKPRAEDGPKDTAPTVALERTFEDESGLYAKYSSFQNIMEKRKI